MTKKSNCEQNIHFKYSFLRMSFLLSAHFLVNMPYLNDENTIPAVISDIFIIGSETNDCQDWPVKKNYQNALNIASSRRIAKFHAI